MARILYTSREEGVREPGTIHGLRVGPSAIGGRGGLMMGMGPHRHESEERADLRRQVAEC